MGLDYTTSGNDREFASSDSIMARFMPEATSTDFNDTVFPFMAVEQVAAADSGGGNGCTLAAAGNKMESVFTSLLPALLFGFVLGRKFVRRKYS